MIRQKQSVIKKTNTTLTYVEMGDVICDSNSNIIITLPLPKNGLWYRITNVSKMNVTINYGEETTTIKEKEQAYFISDETDSWRLNKNGLSNAKTILEKNIDIPNFSGRNGYVLAYNELLDNFYLREMVAGGGGDGGSFLSETVDVLKEADVLEKALNLTETSIPYQ